MDEARLWRFFHVRLNVLLFEFIKRKRSLPRWEMLGFFLNCVLAATLQAGGSGLNTVVVVNQTSSNSCELGNYFCERRHVPPENVLRIPWTGGNILWNSNDFQTTLLSPLLDMLASRQLTNQVDYVVLSMDLPFQTSLPTSTNSTTSALFYGLRGDSGTDPGFTNSYAASEAAFYQARPASAPGYSFLATMITADSLAEAKHLVDQGVASDGLFPTQPAWLAKSSDAVRNIRQAYFDNAIFNAHILGVSTLLRTNTDSPGGLTGLLGFETGLANYSLAPATFVPGAIGDSMTSFGGIIFGPNSQTSLLEFIRAGAAGSYGTVVEPLANTLKFPNPQVYFYQARGFSLAECYYQSISLPYQGLTVAEPLAAPFARAGSGQWDASVSTCVLSGISPLSVQFVAHDTNRPLQQVDLFVDGKYRSTLTNLAPAPGNLLTVSLNGYPFNYIVPTNASLKTVAAEMAGLINTPAATNVTRVKALVRGDRIELQSLSTNLRTAPFFFADPGAASSTGRTYRVSCLPASYPPRMIPAGPDDDGVFRMQVEMPTALSYVVQASTNLADWLPLLTNTAPGLLDFQDAEAPNFSRRFYRISGPVPDRPPVLSKPDMLGGVLRLRVENEPGQPCALFASTNLHDWIPLQTNDAGGVLEFIDPGYTNFGQRYFRAGLVMPAPPVFTVLNTLNGTPLVRVDSATKPYTVAVSTNAEQWNPLATNFQFSGLNATAGSAAGDAETHATFLTASRSAFPASEACGLQEFRVFSGQPAAGAWLQLTITKTNSEPVMVAVTNETGGSVAAYIMAAQLYSTINSNAALQGADGVVAEDFNVNAASLSTFNLRARSPGCTAAGMRAYLRRSAGLTVQPSSERTLTQNLSDLLPRNHLYVSAGATNLSLACDLDTTTLEDGWHELTAVAYEGTHVRTQTRATLSVRVQNTALSATLTLLDLTNPAPVNATYHFQVDAGTNEVASTTLFTTGGACGVTTNSPLALFEVSGTNLWAGLHPFYALVETPTGLKYRTETRWIRLVNEP